VLFFESPSRSGTTGANPGVLVLAPYQKPYTKDLGKDGGLLLGHQHSAMHNHAE